MAFVAVAGVFIVVALWPVRPHDFWWHVRVGQWIVEHGRVPSSDLFSFTRSGQPYAFSAWWLMDVVFYLLLRAGDLPLVVFFHATVVTAAYGLLLRTNQDAAAGNLRWAAVATVVAAAVGLDNWNVRPQSISILLFALTLYLVERHAASVSVGRLPPDRAGVLWWLPPLFTLWANCHGAFSLGLLLLGSYLLAYLLAWIGKQQRFPGWLLAVTALSLVATLLTPAGLGRIRHLLGITRHSVVRQLTLEWMPPTVASRDGQLFFGLALAVLVLLVASRRRPTSHESLRLLLFGILALLARRNTIWFGFVAAPTLAACLGCWPGTHHVGRDDRVGRVGVNYAFAGVVALAVLLSLPWFRPYLPLPEERRAYVHPETPVQAVAFLRELSPPRRVFHSEAYGSYMIWASPEMPVFIDTRIELYPLEQWLDYLALSHGRYDWEALLARYRVDTLLLERETQQPLIEAATASPNWVQVYEDEGAVVLVRREGA